MEWMEVHGTASSRYGAHLAAAAAARSSSSAAAPRSPLSCGGSIELMEMGLSSEFGELKISPKRVDFDPVVKLLQPFEQLSGWGDAAMEEEDVVTAGWAPGASAEGFAFPAAPPSSPAPLSIRAPPFTVADSLPEVSAPRAVVCEYEAFTTVRPVKKARVVPIDGGAAVAMELFKLAARAPRQRMEPKVSLCARHAHLTVEDLPKKLQGCACAGILAARRMAAERRGKGGVNEEVFKHAQKKLRTAAGGVDTKFVFTKA